MDNIIRRLRPGGVVQLHKLMVSARKLSGFLSGGYDCTVVVYAKPGLEINAFVKIKEEPIVFNLDNDIYGADLTSFRELGLTPFKGLAHAEEFYCGEVRSKVGNWVRVWVTCLPAHFWRFEIYCSETKTIHSVSTGSGVFNQYWLLAKAISEGIFVIKGMETLGGDQQTLGEAPSEKVAP